MMVAYMIYDFNLFRFKSHAEKWWDGRLDWNFWRAQGCSLELLPRYQCPTGCFGFGWFYSVCNLSLLVIIRVLSVKWSHIWCHVLR